MSYFTQQQIFDEAARAGGSTSFSAEVRLKAEAKSARTSYDVFLSHAFTDARLILGVKAVLEAMGLTVYVDWLDDPELDRGKVTSSTADRLRQRMQQSKSLIFATSQASVVSKWMPWELGYFDGRHGSEQVAIFPLVASSDSTFLGQEYLGLYPRVEQLRSTYGYTPEAVVTRGQHYRESKALRDFVNGRSTFSASTFQQHVN